jgi:actin
MYPGITERLTREMQDYVRGDHAERVKVVAQPDRKYATWIGGSIVASTVGTGRKWVTKAEYDEVGPGAVHRLFGVGRGTG